MSILDIIWVWLAFWVVNILVAVWNDHVRRVRIRLGDPRQIEHFWYGLGYCILSVAPCWYWHIWWELGAILLLHLSVFTVAFNLAAGEAPFNLSKTSKALTDRFWVWCRLKSYEIPAIAAFTISIIFIILQIHFNEHSIR